MFGTDLSCIILAGGLGTRLRGSIGDTPKCMAPVAGKPFIEYLFRYLQKQGVRDVVLSLGYRAEIVQEWLGAQEWPFGIRCVVETEPLGTGGGISLALRECSSSEVFVLNGDTYFDVDLQHMLYRHLRSAAQTTIALKELQNFERYGTVELHANPDFSGWDILAFNEKRAMQRGLINGGIYCIDRESFLALNLPEKFSFEKDYLEAQTGRELLYGYRSNGYFIDIGVPEDFERAQTDFPTLFPA